MESDSSGSVDLAWDGGRLALDVPPGDRETGEVVRLLRGSRLISDCEIRYPSEEAVGPLEKRQQSRVAARLLDLSKMYGLASREMSLVAVVKRSGDRPGELPETRVVPVGMAQDTSFPAYFRGPGPKVAFSLFAAAAPPLSRDQHSGARTKLRTEPAPQFCRDTPSRRPGGQTPGATEATSIQAELVDLAAMLEPDGGMPGKNPGVRRARTIAATLAFVAAGHTLTAGVFRLHVTRLVGFIKSITPMSEAEERLVGLVLDAASTGKAPAGPWLALAREPGTRWKQVEQAIEA